MAARGVVVPLLLGLALLLGPSASARDRALEPAPAQPLVLLSPADAAMAKALKVTAPVVRGVESRRPKLLVVSTADGVLHAVDGRSGALQWSINAGHILSGVLRVRAPNTAHAHAA
jgi:hypothetical protein